MNLKHTHTALLFAFFALGVHTASFAQGGCTNPINLSSVLISNTQCGASTGTIIITPDGGVGAYVFEWQPNVSNSNVATNLAANAYNVHIERANDPSCTLDTLVIVNNSNGPAVTPTIAPAECLASNGSISLQPTNFQFQWSNGASSSAITGLASQNYYVTITDPNTGCFVINKYFVPKNLDALSVSSTVQEHTKCGQSIGKAMVEVTGGSGQYSFNPPGPQYNNLAGGDHPVFVVDNATGCTGSTNIVIQDLQVNGSVSVTPHDVQCPGQNTGFVEFVVTPGQNFELPYVFTLKDANGTSFSPGQLPAGTYFLQIFDADGCALPVVSFDILQPPGLNLQALASPESCNEGGQIMLDISGGNGSPYIVNWADLLGEDNPKDRMNLHAGYYSAVIFDSLFCTYKLDTVLISPNCNNLTQTDMVLGVNSTDYFCVTKPEGVATGATTFSLLGGGQSGSSLFGTWVLSVDGCLAYSAGSTAGTAVDEICIISTAPQIGLQDTVCVVVSITQEQPTKTSVFFTVQVESSSTACGTIPSGFSNIKILQLGEPGLSGTSDVFGEYKIDSLTACLTFFAANTPGFNVDEIRVAVLDTQLNRCHIISYLPTVLPKTDCSSALNLADTLHFITTNCDGMAFGCVPIPYDDVVNYTIIDNSALYTAGYLGCATDTTISYNLSTLPPGGGPYQLTEWLINGQNHTGNFLNVNGLVELMNIIDAPPNGWTAQGVSFIRGGKLASTYGPLKIRSATGNTAIYPPSTLLVPLGTELRFVPGVHQVIFRNVLTACSDTVIVNAVCYDCAPVHSYPLDAFGNVKWEAASCASDTVFCTNIPNNDLGEYMVTDNGQPFVNFTLCGNFVGMILDTGYHQLHFRNTITTCQWSVRFYLDCKNILEQQTIFTTVNVGSSATVCLDTTVLSSPIISIVNLCDEEGSTIIGYSLNNANWCALINGLSIGSDTLCLQLCNGNGECANYTVFVNVTSGSGSDSLRAVMDVVFGLQDETKDISIIANDIIGGLLGNFSGLSGVEFLSDPLLGSIAYNPVTGVVSYTPDPGRCGVDSFAYRITDKAGRQSAATVKITISCEDILIFKGISPNGDGRNDTWQILGIERYPDNEIQVFNRWGNLVFEQKGYTNAAPWTGQWNGKDLPDGTYFYMLSLGSGAGKMSGWIEIIR